LGLWFRRVGGMHLLSNGEPWNPAKNPASLAGSAAAGPTTQRIPPEIPPLWRDRE